MLTGLIILAVLGAAGLLLVNQASIAVWTISYGVLGALWIKYGTPGIFSQFLLLAFFVGLVFCSITPLRRKFISLHLFKLVKSVSPEMSATEREALEAGTIGWEKELFSGKPNFNQLRNFPKVQLRDDERAFLEGPVKVLCSKLDDWDITHNRVDLSPEVWEYIKEQGFLGMIIPRSYGGLEFSATTVMSVLSILYGKSITAATTVAVPNSLGPAELLLKYGTEEQKNYYLPRLADGTEIPCFALTGPNAGSDAASIPDQGIVCYQEVHGEQVLGVRLNWDKRYITLCPVATIIGLAFRLFDPDNILKRGLDIGISCALIPANTPGVSKGRRHFPLNTGFLNGPTQGKDVFVPLTCLIGGEERAGQGWLMLMECLSAGRAISLPSSALGGAQAAAMACGAYARIRKQFNQPIAKFEGIEEALTRIAGNAYLINGALTMTVNAIDHGVKSGVAGAILKYHTTERARQVAIDAMDIHGGKGICLGPNNYIGRGYQGAAISITVEGANILTRSLIIFGQGAIRCHPYVLAEMESVRNKDLKAFDHAIWGHFAFMNANLFQTLIFAFTDGRWTKTPNGVTKRYFEIIRRYSANLAFLADFSLIFLGAKLKRKEKISARLGDILSNLYLASGVLKQFHADGEPMEDLPLVEWCCQHLLHECETAMQGVIANFPVRWGRMVLRLLVRPFGYHRTKPSDSLGRKIARVLTEPNAARTRLTPLVYAEAIDNCPLGRLEAAFHAICAVEPIEKKVVQAVKAGTLLSLTLLQQIDEALQKGILTDSEATELKFAEIARQKIIAVDDFSNEELTRVVEVKKDKKKLHNKMILP